MKTKRFILTAAAIAMIFLIMTGCLIDPQMMMRYQQQYGQNNSVFSSAGSGSYNAEQSQIQTMTQANGGETPLIASAEEGKAPCLIEGRYTNKQVTSYQTAIASLCDVNAVMGIENPTREFAGESINEYNGSKFYKLQQKYNGIDVYGKQLIVTTDNYGSTQSLTGNYEKLENVATTPRIDVRTAAQAAAQELGSAVTSTPETVIYALDQTPELAYVFEEPSCSIIISAQTGKVIDNISNIYTSNEDNWEIPKVLRDGKYWLEDTKRGIIIKGSLERENSRNKNGQIIQSVLDNASPITAPENGGRFEIENKIGMEDYSSTDAIKLYHFLIVANDYYLKKVGIKPFSNQDDTVYGYINDGYDGGKNGYSSTRRQNGKFVTRIVIGFDMEITADLVGHEYTHSVERTVSNMFYSNESGAIMEAYSDVMGELIEEYEWGWADWVHNSRKLNNPSSNGKPSKYLDDNYYTGKDDNGGVHHNSTVISHAMYKIHNSGKVTSDELAELLYRTLFYLNQSCSFVQYRFAVETAANDMGLAQDALNEIKKAFNEANIRYYGYNTGGSINYEGSATLSGRVISAETKQPMSGVKVCVSMLKTIKAYCMTDKNGCFSMGVPDKKEMTFYLQYGDSNVYNEQTIFVDGPTNMGDIELTKEKKAAIRGVVIDDSTSKPIEGVNIILREGKDSKSGEAYLNTTAVTDNNGQYTLENIPYGMYTIEASKEGYTTEFRTVTSSQTETTWNMTSSQDIRLKPTSLSSAYDASLYIPYVEAAIRDTQDYYYDGYGHYVEALPFNYGKLYDITGDGYPELFTIHNKGGYEGVFEVFTQRNGSVERIFEKRYSLRYTDSDNGFLGIVVASGSFGLSSDKILGLSYGLGDAGGYEHNVEVYCITDTRVYLVVSFEIVVEDSEFTSIKKVNPDGSYVNISANEYIELISKMDASANNTEAVFGNTNMYGYYFEEFGDMTTLYDLLIQLKS